MLTLSCENESESGSVVSDSLRLWTIYSPWNSPGHITGVGSLSLLQGIFPIQGSNPGLPHQVDSLPAEPQGKPKITGVHSTSLLQRIFPAQKSNQGLEHCRWILHQMSYQGSLIHSVFYEIESLCPELVFSLLLCCLGRI